MEIENFKKNCNHKYEDGSSAIKKHIDDEDFEDEEMNIWYYATYEEWEECEICGMQRNIK